jgi:two-component system response regulator ChvI
MKIKNNKLKILIVDDEDDITLSFKRILEIHGFEVDAFSDSILALSKFKVNYYDIALLDIKMPNLDGFDLYKKIKEMDNKIKICFLTASEAYYQQYREKAIELEELLKRINDLMK